MHIPGHPSSERPLQKSGMRFPDRTFVAVCVLVLALLAAAAPGRAASSTRPAVIDSTRAKAESITGEISADLPEKLETAIRNYFGMRYRMGGNGRNGIDCSALVQKVYADVFDIDLPRNSREQSRLDRMEDILDEDIETGDLLFFGPQRARVTHVGIYLAGGYFLHAVRSEGVTISRLDGAYWKSRWMLTKRVKGLQSAYDEEQGTALDSALTRLSFSAAFAGTVPAENLRFLEGGLKFNDWPEVRLAGFFTPAIGEPVYDPGVDPFFFLRAESLQRPKESTTDGFRLSTVFSPFAWEGLSLIPSVTQISGRGEGADLEKEYQTLGLETRVELPSSRLALFMGASAQNREDIFEQPLRLSPDWRTLDVSFGLHYRLSDTLNFSLSGTRSCSFLGDDEALGLDRPLKDISSSLNFQF